MIEFETWTPVRQERTLDAGEIETVYRSLAPGTSATFTWNDLGDDVVIVSVAADHSTVSMLHDETWYYLTTSDSDEEVEVDMAGQKATVPRGAVLDRDLGLEVLRQVGDLPRLLAAYSWREQ